SCRRWWPGWPAPRRRPPGWYTWRSARRSAWRPDCWPTPARGRGRSRRSPAPRSGAGPARRGWRATWPASPPGRARARSRRGGVPGGQAAIARAGGWLAAVGVGSAGVPVAVAAGCLLLAAATAAAALGVRLPDRARRWRLAVTAVLAGYGCARPGWFAAAHLLPDRRWFAGAGFLAVFAGGRWEASTPIAPRLAGR